MDEVTTENPNPLTAHHKLGSDIDASPTWNEGPDACADGTTPPGSGTCTDGSTAAHPSLLGDGFQLTNGEYPKVYQCTTCKGTLEYSDELVSGQ